MKFGEGEEEEQCSAVANPLCVGLIMFGKSALSNIDIMTLCKAINGDRVLPTSYELSAFNFDTHIQHANSFIYVPASLTLTL